MYLPENVRIKLVQDLLGEIISNEVESNLTYSKFLFILKLLKEDNLNQELKNRLSNRISSNNIENSLANTNFILLETTEKCNLNCSYCAYGDLYLNEKRDGLQSEFIDAKNVIDSFIKLWNSKESISTNGFHIIGFYGGEPLLNFEFIEQIVEYLNNQKVKHRGFVYTMTTNGLLLDKYMDFIVKNEFRILISLDGSFKHNKYRLTKNKINSYKIVYDNIKKLSLKYPEYFDKKVSFNSVYTSLSDENEIRSFFKKEFSKSVNISPLSISNLNYENISDFNKLYKQYINQKSSQDKLLDKYIREDIKDFVRQSWGKSYRSYKDWLNLNTMLFE